MQKQTPRLPDVSPPAPDLTRLIGIVTIAQRMAARYLAGRTGLAMERDAREIEELSNELPDDVRVLL